jgi:hypothetical protein
MKSVWSVLCKPWAKPTEAPRKKCLSPRGPERFDPFRVGKLGWNTIRGRRAQKPCPCARLLIFNPAHCLICLHRQPKMSLNKDAALAPQRAFMGDLN